MFDDVLFGQKSVVQDLLKLSLDESVVHHFVLLVNELVQEEVAVMLEGLDV